ncbi:MAG: hypothetical protein OEZ65_13015 [Gemmatimonadota bacterium]|nr:hypothetical protein [Gemmatimonadota bacterium]MDH5760503.1 hypothetical protein [Gemmatimonadota bacterium]
MDVLAFILVFAVIALGIFAYAAVQAERRATALAAAAERLGFSYRPLGPDHLHETLAHFHLFSQGRDRAVENHLSGSTGDIEVQCFDYRYTTGGGKNSRTYRQSVILFRWPVLDLPEFVLRPENIFHKIGQVFGYQDIDFDHHPAFSEAYLLRGSDERGVRSVFTDEVIAHFKGLTRASAEGRGSELVFYRHGKRAEPAALDSFLQEGIGTLSSFRR